MPEEQGSHYMLLEILEEPTALRETLGAIAGAWKKIASELAAEGLGMVYFTGSGTSYHAYQNHPGCSGDPTVAGCRRW